MTDALQFLVLTTAARPNRQQEDVIGYLREENRILREKIGSKHQGLGNELLSGEHPPTITGANVKRHKRGGGLLSYYHREAARTLGPVFGTGLRRRARAPRKSFKIRILTVVRLLGHYGHCRGGGCQAALKRTGWDCDRRHRSGHDGRRRR